jgi:hypothetical protein
MSSMTTKVLRYEFLAMLLSHHHPPTAQQAMLITEALVNYVNSGAITGLFPASDPPPKARPPRRSVSV